MGGTPSNFSDAQLTEYAYMISGGTWDPPGGVVDWFLGDTYTASTSGMRGVTAALTSGDNPYTDFPLWDPLAPESPLHTAVNSVRRLEEALQAYDAQQSFSNSFADTMSVVTSNTNQETSDVLTAVKNRKDTDLLESVAKLNARFTAYNTVNSSARLIYIALLEAEAQRGIDEIEAKLKSENLARVYEAVRTRLDSERVKLATMVQFTQQTITLADFYVKAKVQHQSMQLSVESEDLLWESKAQLNYAKAVSSLNGAAVIPEAPSRIMEGASTVFSGISSIVPVIAAFA